MVAKVPKCIKSICRQKDQNPERSHNQSTHMSNTDAVKQIHVDRAKWHKHPSRKKNPALSLAVPISTFFYEGKEI